MFGQCPGWVPRGPRSLQTFTAWNLRAHLGSRVGLAGPQAHRSLLKSTLGGDPQPPAPKTEWRDPPGLRVTEEA